MELIRIRIKTAENSTLEALLCNNRITIKDRELDMLEVLKAIINAEITDKNIAEALNEYFVDDLNNYVEEKAREKLLKELISRIPIPRGLKIEIVNEFKVETNKLT
jgi:isocitrate dehydrogenase kinase/phosphatase